MEIYFLAPNFASFYSGKKWVRVLLNENHNNEARSINHSNSTESNVVDSMGIDKNNNILVMLIKDPIFLTIENTFLEKRVSENGLRKSMRGLKIGESSVYVSEGEQKMGKRTLNGDRLFVRKDHCNCSILENSFSDIIENESGEFYSLMLDGKNSVNNPIFIQTISLILLLFKWIILLMYIVAQLLLPLKVMRQVLNKKLLKSSAISIFYVTSASLSLSITGIEGKDCINWWFLGSSPEYLIVIQVFVWFIAMICLILYLIQYFLEIKFNISRRYKLMNDFITTFIFIPAGLLIIVSVSLCILGIVKPWIFMIWVTTVIIEFEKNLRILVKIYDENFVSDTETNSNRNFVLFQTNNIRQEQNNEINIIELREEVCESDLERIKERNPKLSGKKENEMVVIPISNSYFKILDSRFENFSTNLCLWYITQHKEMENKSISKIELEEYSNKNKLKILEFSISDFLENLNFEEKSQNENLPSVCSTKTNFSDSTISRINSFHTENISESTNNQFICNICFLDFDSIIIFSPCGHGNVCLDCLGDYISNNFKQKQHPKCHICREDISRMIEIQKDNEFNSGDRHLLEETESFESTLSKKINTANQNSERQIHLISNIKLIAEITCNPKNNNSLNYNTSSNSESCRNSNSNIITLKISRKNSNLWSHPRIKEFINNKDNKLKTKIYNHFTRFFTNSNRRIS
ncbi:uncharacterized protein cubi_02042 [Cryptosporidium ubiquitum]|uniref:RING-type domain-containing protein n=1 Tax=Cryptosporidium ubiquitum TaxID=857276 RepID=A0A1J4MMQ3_9CRYT|nr:uncharacterized protein cubi_02042 [Cryptosporidium ubiquitum]OII75521.1 hypothetical protein cubi_02042 [Cryptosporidium ubiquitum]